MAKSESFAKQLAAAERLAESVRVELLDRPGVVLVGAGAERRRGRPTGRPAIVVSVRRKLSKRALRAAGFQPLPDAIEGVPVDVVVYAQSPETGAVRREFARAIAAKDRVATRWLRERNVTGIGVGYKRVGGKPTEQVAIHVLVADKLSPDLVAERGFALVPATIAGIPTDVIEGGPFTASVSPSGSRGDRRDPLIGGLSIGHATAPFHYGTLAAIAFDASGAVWRRHSGRWGRARCSDYHWVAVLRPVGLDQSWSVVLRPWSEAHSTISRTPAVMIAAVGPSAEVPAPDRDAISAFLGEQGLSPEDTRAIEAAKQNPCPYYGEFASDGVPSGSWRHWMFVQTQNTVPPGTEPLEAARVIGGLPLSDHYRSTLDVACGPLIFEEDGSFDIELT